MSKILFLYTELAEYFLACLQDLEKSGNNVVVIHWPVNREAPFQFRKLETTVFHDRSVLNKSQLENLVDSIDPDIILCSGWIDKDYLQVCKKYQTRIPVVLLLDNHWRGTPKQILATMVSGITLRNRFSSVWVPGTPQSEYARKLGFPETAIHHGFYSADNKLFCGYYEKFREEKSKSFPHRLLFIGRYSEVKGIRDLWEVFISLHAAFPDWELWCTGTGELWDERVQHPFIRHFGFVQPSEMGEIIRQSGIFVLPSHKEPWGVVVHEMTAAGFPLLCSDTIGSTTTFLQQGVNGWTFKTSDRNDLRAKMQRLMSLPDDQLLGMGDESQRLSKQITCTTWVQTLLGFISSKHRG